jgi:SAM-dependent methyltransferase
MVDRKEHWESIYHDKSPREVSWYQKDPALSLQLIRNTQLSLAEPMIDVGGGASVLVDCLCQEGYTRVAVLDISASALDHAKARLGDKAHGVEWYVEDIVDFNPPHPFSLWHDRAVFHFLTDPSDRHRYVDVMKRVLKTGGHLIIAAFAIGGPAKCSGLEIVQYDAEKLLTELGEGFELAEEKTEVHTTPAQREQKFAWFRLVRKPATPASSR